ncbi:acyl-CoA dehydratase activase [Chloroflexota bacterium]
MYFAGVDIGSTMTKVVIVDKDGGICAHIIGPTGAEHRRLANRVMEEALKQSGLCFNEMEYVVATGYGRFNVPFADHKLTELTCHTRGVASLFPGVKTAIDIGGQDAKGLKINNGKLVNFVMNDKCAAGTGRFLEVIADTLGIKVEDLGKVSSQSNQRVGISNICTIFAQQEVVARLSDAVSVEDILAGLHDAIASRVITMVQRLKIEPDVVLTGGVAMNTGVVKAVKEKLECEVFVPEQPLLSGALGAALLAKEYVLDKLVKEEPIIRKERQLAETTFFG